MTSLGRYAAHPKVVAPWRSLLGTIWTLLAPLGALAIATVRGTHFAWLVAGGIVAAGVLIAVGIEIGHSERRAADSQAGGQR